MPKGYLTPQQAAKRAGINAANISLHCRLGNLPAVQKGRRWYIKETDLKRFIEERPDLGTRGLGKRKFALTR